MVGQSQLEVSLDLLLEISNRGVRRINMVVSTDSQHSQLVFRLSAGQSIPIGGHLGSPTMYGLSII